MSQEAATGLDAIDIPRLSAADCEATAAHFASGPAHPVIYTDALADWPAAAKWSLDFFANQFGGHFGLIPTSFFDGSWGKATSLREYLAHLDHDADETPGFWVDDKGMPLGEAPEGAVLSWAFYWRALRDYPQLFDDIGHYPQGCGNLVERLPRDVMRKLEWATKRDFYSIYISRKDTITPLHADYHGTVGSLAQFEGSKIATLIAPADGDTKALEAFDPEAPDFAQFPQLRGRTAYRGTLNPGELLIIPPRWWHHVRALDHSLTLSHNFFTPHNIGDFLRGLFTDLAAKDMTVLQDMLAKQLD